MQKGGDDAVKNAAFEEKNMVLSTIIQTCDTFKTLKTADKGNGDTLVKLF